MTQASGVSGSEPATSTLPRSVVSDTVERVETAAYDVVVVGGGAAGLRAAPVLGRAKRRVAVVDAAAPRRAPAEHMPGFLSREGMPPAELPKSAREEVRGYGVEIVDDEAVAPSPSRIVANVTRIR